MSNTYTFIQKITLSASASSVTFTNIPQTFTDLVIYQAAMSDVTTALAGNYNLEFNGVTTGYSGRRLYSDPSGGTASDSGTSKWGGFIPGSGALQNTPNSCIIYIPNYTSSNNKSWYIDTIVENNATNGYLGIGANLWANSAAITSLTLSGISSSIYTGNFLRNSTFYLYGVAKLNVTSSGTAKATGGDSITTDGTYWYHTFLSSGTFTPKSSLSCDVLVVAGGGGATNGNGEGSGGGGAGGLCYQTGRSVATSTAYTVTVGAGGTGASVLSGASAPTQGGNSVFDTITANGGGASRSESLSPTSLRNGGSGGGGGGNSTGAGTATQGTSGGATGYGNNGGTGYASNPYTGGGGGGAGAVGANSSSTAGGNGGAGLNTWSSWATATGTGVSGYYAGGGGGGNYLGSSSASSGGSGGGGNGGKSTTGGTLVSQPTAGVANTGGGAGGGQASSTFVNGGSGIVIVRYPV